VKHYSFRVQRNQQVDAVSLTENFLTKNSDHIKVVSSSDERLIIVRAKNVQAASHASFGEEEPGTRNSSTSFTPNEERKIVDLHADSPIRI
jgi:hypothetical protein